MALLFRSFTLLITCCQLGGAASLTSVREIRALDRDVAATNLPARLEGVITYVSSEGKSSFVLQDATAGIFIRNRFETQTDPDVEVRWPQGLDSLERGMRVVVEGVTEAGQIAPIVDLRSIRIVGREPLPIPDEINLDELKTGAYDCQLVEMTAIVRFARGIKGDRLTGQIDLIQKAGRFTAHLKGQPEDFDYDRLIDSKVRLRGVCFGIYNTRGELLEPRLQISQPEDIVVLEPGIDDPFSAPLVPVKKIYRFSPEGHQIQRYRVIGTVTTTQPGKYFYLQDKGRGIRVNTRIDSPLRIGDRVEASGFPVMEEDFAYLTEAVYRVIPGGVPVKPLEIDASRVFHRDEIRNLSSQYSDIDGLLVSLEGNVLGYDPEISRLYLKSGNLTVPVVLDLPKESPEIPLPGSVVRVSGICRVDLNYGYPEFHLPHPVGLEVLAQSSDALVVLSSPPWWTPGRLWIAVGIVSVILALALAWSGILRRKVAERSAQLALEIESKHNARLEFDAVLRERKRLAADIHDNLEQSLTGVAYQVEAMTLGEKRNQPSAAHLPSLRQSLADVRENLRRTIWNIRSNILDDGDLSAALRKVIERASIGTAAKIHLEVSGERHPVSDFIASQTLMIAQEAITNARKHASAENIRLLLSYLGETLELTIEDDGCGFPENPRDDGEDHYGMQGMKERAARMGADLQWKSNETGTHIALSTPVK